MSIEVALQHARRSSPFNGDGAVMHALADEIDLLRSFMMRRTLDGTNTEWDVFSRTRNELKEKTNVPL